MRVCESTCVYTLCRILQRTNWERDFMAVTLLMIPHMAHNFFGDPAFLIGTGKIRVVIVDGQISRLGMFGLPIKADIIY